MRRGDSDIVKTPKIIKLLVILNRFCMNRSIRTSTKKRKEQERKATQVAGTASRGITYSIENFSTTCTHKGLLTKKRLFLLGEKILFLKSSLLFSKDSDSREGNSLLRVVSL